MRFILIIFIALFAGCASTPDAKKESIKAREANYSRLNINYVERLENSYFEYLNKTIDSMLNDSINDRNKEAKIYTLTSTFFRTERPLEANLSKWASMHPDAFQPYLIRGVYYVNRGWKPRQNERTIRTSGEKIRTRAEYFELAKKDLYKARSLNPSDYISACYLINMLKDSGGLENEIKELYLSGSKISPFSKCLNREYASSMLPRWGGSYRQLESLIQENEDLISEWKELEFLKGTKDADRGAVYYRHRNLRDAKKHYDKALAYGEDAYWLYQRARLHYDSGDFLVAQKYFNRVIEIDPTRLEAYKWLRHIQKML